MITRSLFMESVIHSELHLHYTLINLYFGAHTDTNYRKINPYQVKMILLTSLIGSRINSLPVSSSGLEREKPVTLQWRSAGNAGFVNLLLYVQRTRIPRVHQAKQRVKTSFPLTYLRSRTILGSLFNEAISYASFFVILRLFIFILLSL